MLRFYRFPDGSSPHARGTHEGAHQQVEPGRFIPACAGNAGKRAGWCTCASVHPRMRGERRQQADPALDPPGSSPHARGTPAPRGAGPPGRRFIPACAGNARGFDAEQGRVEVHPRMRGERLSSGSDAAARPGSSPHARGTRGVRRNRGVGVRFIPACAGNALPPVAMCGLIEVHPRMRGERATDQPADSTRAGSSPHARGTRGIEGPSS